MELAARAQPVLGLAWYDVRYESLMADFAAETRRICEFLGIEWTGGMSEFASRVQLRESATPSTAQLARGLDPSAVGPLASLPRADRPVRGGAVTLDRALRDASLARRALQGHCVRCAR